MTSNIVDGSKNLNDNQLGTLRSVTALRHVYLRKSVLGRSWNYPTLLWSTYYGTYDPSLAGPQRNLSGMDFK